MPLVLYFLVKCLQQKSLLHSILGSDPAVKHVNLVEQIDMFAQQENRHDLQYICHRLRKDLNPWSHHSSEKLDDFDLEDYFARFKNLVRVITGEKDSTTESKIKEWSDYQENFKNLDKSEREMKNSVNNDGIDGYSCFTPSVLEIFFSTNPEGVKYE